jgi:programmed cell death protein 4
VHNPTGEGVGAISKQVKAKTAANNNVEKPTGDAHETVVKEGTAKRNITRKKTDDKDSGNYNSVHKKQGGHGKGQWRDEMDPSYEEKVPIDEKDPIYDAAEDSTHYVLSSTANSISEADKRGYDPGTSKAIYGPMLTLSEFKLQLAECIKEYYDSGDADEVIRTLEELGCIEYHAEIVKKAISLSLDKGPRERELTSRLLTCVHPTPLSLKDMETGFIILLDGLDDLSKDVPDAKVCS